MKIKTLLLTGLILLAACDDSKYELGELVPQEYHKILYVKDGGKQEVALYDIEDDIDYTLSVVKAGSNPNQTANANIRVLTSEELISKYSEPEAINYQIVSQEAYTLGATSVEFSVDDRYKLVTVSMKPQVVKALLESQPDAKWVLPLEVVSETDSINSTMSELFLQFPSVVLPSLGFTDPSFAIKEYKYEEVSGSTFKENIEINLDVENKWDLEWELAIDEAYLEKYNTANKTVFKLLPAATYTLPEGSKMSMAEGTSKIKLEIPIDGSKIQPGDYMLPVRMKNISMFEINAERDIYPLAVRILGNKLDHTDWGIEANTQEASGEGSGNGVASCVFNPDLSKFWHSQWQGGSRSLPHELTIDTKGEYSFTQVSLRQRQNSGYHDTKTGELLVSDDKVNWTKVGDFMMKQIMDAQVFGVTPTQGRYLMIRITESYRGTNTSLSEVVVYGLK